MTSDPQPPGTHQVTVIGTGNMGSALARAMLEAGYQVTVWNRTRSRADPLQAAGAIVAGSPAEAASGSDVVIMCVADQATCEVLLADQSLTETLRGKVLVQLTTTTPADSRGNARRADGLGIGYLDGAIMAYPRDIGSARAVILICGSAAGAADVQRVLGPLGTVRFMGEDAGRAQIVDAALIGFFYGTIVGYVQAAALATAEGMAIEEFIDLAGPFFAGFISSAVAETAERVAAGRYDAPESSMVTHLGGVENLVLGACRDAGVETGIVSAMRNALARAIEAGHGQEDIACLAETMGPRPVRRRG
jgi:3-hydroxyisobutyrate dehydrogenase-like beta-hydroxyacid dehydrogenase